jgi:MinD-like ATPase involved in chromosome partitioning or flagellar assembly
MINQDKRIRIITGHYGSGKTEFAINYSLKLAQESQKTALIDLDIVNPYFRSREKQDLLNQNKIKVISNSLGINVGVDLPAISAEVESPLQNEHYDVIIDAGGDPIGAKVLGRYNRYFQNGNYDMFCVINANRPFTQNLQDTIEMIKKIELSAQIKVTGLINNTHMLKITSIDDVLKGQELIKKISAELNIPIRYISVMENLVDDLPDHIKGEVFPIKMYMREDWMS